MDGQWAENFYTLKACTDEVAKMRDQYGDSVLADCYNEQQAWTWTRPSELGADQMIPLTVLRSRSMHGISRTR